MWQDKKYAGIKSLVENWQADITSMLGGGNFSQIFLRGAEAILSVILTFWGFQNGKTLADRIVVLEVRFLKKTLLGGAKFCSTPAIKCGKIISMLVCFFPRYSVWCWVSERPETENVPFLVKFYFQVSLLAANQTTNQTNFSWLFPLGLKVFKNTWKHQQRMKGLKWRDFKEISWLF